MPEAHHIYTRAAACISFTFYALLSHISRVSRIVCKVRSRDWIDESSWEQCISAYSEPCCKFTVQQVPTQAVLDT